MRLPRTALLLSIAWLASVAAICDPGENPNAGDDPSEGILPDPEPIPEPEPILEPEPVDPLCTDPCQGDQILFGPETFHRACGRPKTERRLFSLPTERDVCVVVTNDGNASTRIKIDGGEIVGPSDFNPHVTLITRTVNLAAGEHELKIRVVSIPGTSVTVEIRACDQSDPPQLPCSVVATEWCLEGGWNVSLTQPGGLICTAPGVDYNDNCATCEDYNLLVWTDGTGDPLCPREYNTIAGMVFGGHEPCACTNDLLTCGVWELEGCIPD